MPLQLRQVLERVGSAQLAGVDQGHEQIAHLSAIQRLIKQGIFAMEHSPLQSLFADVVIQRCARMAQESSQAFQCRNR